MSALLFALALFMADQPPAGADAPASAAADQPAYPRGAPRDDYGLVSWCYGALRGYLDLHDQVMPEVTRIESEFRRPGSKLSDDLAVYDAMQKEGRKSLKTFARSMEAAEKASLKPINAIGAAALQKGRATWAAAPNMPKARVAQEWMSWTLPARCESAAAGLEQRAKLMGTAFQVNAEPDPLAAPEAPLPGATPAP
jgi:hypothetical protein